MVYYQIVHNEEKMKKQTIKTGLILIFAKIIYFNLNILGISTELSEKFAYCVNLYYIFYLTFLLLFFFLNSYHFISSDMCTWPDTLFLQNV
jgi:hypothetical protein